MALPFLESLAPRQARAAPAARRFIAIKTYNPPVVHDWYPTRNAAERAVRLGGTKADGTFLATTPLGPSGSGYTQAPLAAFAEDGLSTIVGKALAPLYHKMLMIRGLDFVPNSHHNDGGFLGNYDSEDPATRSLPDGLEQWPTIDQVLAQSKTFYPTTPAQRSVHVGNGTGRGVSFAGSVGAITRRGNERNPRNAFQALFGRFVPAATAATAAVDGAAREVLIVDRVLEDYRRTMRHPRLGAADRRHLELFVNHMAELQAKLRRFDGPTPAACSKPAQPTAGGEASSAEVKAQWDAFVDLIVAAIICDQTRIATLDVRKALMGAGGGVLFHNQDGFSGWHGDAHNWASAAARTRMTQAYAWVAENVFLKLAQKLDVPDGTGRTYLDNSIVYWGGELGFGHLAYSVPCLIAGSAGGYLRTGRYLDYIDWLGQRSYFAQEGGNAITGIPHNQLCNTILQAMGLVPEDYERGRRGFGIIDPVNKGADMPRAWKMDRVGDILPGIRA
jgi:hypothetical protein